MYSNSPAKRWEDALISGNGIMGIMVYGDPANEKIIFNHEFLYEPIGSENVEPPLLSEAVIYSTEGKECKVRYGEKVLVFITSKGERRKLGSLDFNK